MAKTPSLKASIRPVSLGSTSSESLSDMFAWIGMLPVLQNSKLVGIRLIISYSLLSKRGLRGPATYEYSMNHQDHVQLLQGGVPSPQPDGCGPTSARAGARLRWLWPICLDRARLFTRWIRIARRCESRRVRCAAASRARICITCRPISRSGWTCPRWMA